MQWVFDTRALAVGTAQEVVKRGGDSWFFITDYAFGHRWKRMPCDRDQERRQGARRGAAAVCDARFIVLHPAAQASKVKITALLADRRNEIKTAAEFGVFAGGQQMAALLVLITDVH